MAPTAVCVAPMPTDQIDRTRSAPAVLSVYDELRDLAARYLSRQPREHTLQPTALVHEAYLRLCGQTHLSGLDAQAFFCVAAKAMRSVLVDHARRRLSIKRGGNLRRLPLDDTIASYEERAFNLVPLDEVLTKLAELDPDLARLVDLRFFGGMTEREIAEILSVSVRTVRRDWRIARLWLFHELSKGEDGDARPVAPS